CKVIFILNTDVLDLDDAKTLQLFNEKVLDSEILLNPTTEEAINIAFKENNTNSTTIKQAIQKLKINNIRIIKKIEANCKR
ncbi:hypothetical protein, partial [Lactococcus petauri]|uniref:hypothetical protein n=1 Tax=Lactococcus petauri TaxID=1940789 RepID=UPI0021F1C602